MPLSFKYAARAVKSNGYFYTSSQDYTVAYTITDIKDNANDNTTQLGDIANDMFSSTGPAGTFHDAYVGKTTSGFIGTANDSYYFYSNVMYANNTKLTSFVADKPGVPFTYESIPCYVSGTEILTKRGNIAVECLAPGDIAITSSGKHRTIRWIGHRVTDCRRHPRPHEAMPVRVSAHAFGPNRPARDLMVSPGHALCVDVVGEVLIPAVALVNGTTITQEDVERVTYWHVELESHDILLAENLPAESYLDMGNRGYFGEAEIVDLGAGPDANPSRRTHADFCRPFHGGGPLVDVVRAQLAKRAETSGWTLTSDLLLHLVVDGRRLDPVVRNLTARFHVPADAKDVWLVSPTARPCDMLESGDSRDLGVCIGALAIDEGFGAPRAVALADPLLCFGFHDVEDGGRRWTAGRARLPAALWTGCEDGFYLRVDLARPPLPRWIAPTDMPGLVSAAAAA